MTSRSGPRDQLVAKSSTFTKHKYLLCFSSTWPPRNAPFPPPWVQRVVQKPVRGGIWSHLATKLANKHTAVRKQVPKVCKKDAQSHTKRHQNSTPGPPESGAVPLWPQNAALGGASTSKIDKTIAANAKTSGLIKKHRHWPLQDFSSLPLLSFHRVPSSRLIYSTSLSLPCIAPLQKHKLFKSKHTYTKAFLKHTHALQTKPYLPNILAKLAHEPLRSGRSPLDRYIYIYVYIYIYIYVIFHK